MKPPLRTVLRNFLNHFEDYEARKNICDDQYEHEFQQLKKLTDQLKNDNEYGCSYGLKDVNRPKNRYKDIVPYDKSRVILPKWDGIPGSDYINASHIKGASGAFAYIAAQGPLQNTLIDFWRMIWICEVQVIVMACNEIESGKNKCEKYWPCKGKIENYGNISVELIDTTQVCPDFLIRTLLVKCDSEMRDVYQFHYTSWPDHGIPDTVQPILELVRLMRQCQASETMPIVVHCSAGCGRTGTICAVDFVWACLRHGKLSEDFSLFQIALELRRQRIAMIQTKEQYILAHKAVATLFEQQLNVIDCHPYVNIDEDGEPLIWKELTKNKKSALKDKSAESDVISKRKAVSEFNIDLEVKTNGSVKESPVRNHQNPEQLQRNSLNDLIETRSLSKQDLQSKISISDSLANCSRGSESNISQNSSLSQQNHEDSIPFIDDDDVCIRPQCGRAYLNMPSCDSISKLVGRFDPFVDKVVLETDESSPEAEVMGFHPNISSQKQLLVNPNYSNSSESDDVTNEQSLKPKNLFRGSDENNRVAGDCGYKNKPFKRESYPSATGRDVVNDFESVDDKISIQSEQIKGSKKIGRATLMRRPSISKLKALFEKSSCRQSDGGKRLLFRNNSHFVSRAGSAPPSLNCMDQNSATERESILMMVTRKFRSSSVRTEREVNSKASTKPQKSTMANFKEGMATLSRTVSFTLNKRLHANASSSKIDQSSADSSFKDDITNTESQLSPTSGKSKSMWYDKSSLPRKVTDVKLADKPTSNSDTPISPTSKKPEKSKTGPFSFAINKPSKLLPFLNPLGKIDGKDTAMWYSETDNTYTKEIPTEASTLSGDVEHESNKNTNKDNTNKVLPIYTFKPWKKISTPKGTLISSDVPKSSINLASTPTFYTNINSSEEILKTDTLSAPLIDSVPKEVIVMSSDKKSSISSQNEILSTNNVPDSGAIMPHCTNNVLQVEKPPEETLGENVNKTPIKSDIPPAIPKKMHIGKNKQIDLPIVAENKFHSEKICASGEGSSIDKSENNKKDDPPSPNDLYINVNETAIKNIEQIEKTIRNNPRSAIIDLTSRESYCMEEELANAVKQLASPKPAIKGHSKFPGYEVIWPEEPLNKVACKEIQPLSRKGVGYSPPLRRSLKGSLNLSKSNSCSNIDWLEPIENSALNNSFKDGTSSPTKKLVKEAAVELNTLLDRLTSQTLTEEADLKNKDKTKNSSPSTITREHDIKNSSGNSKSDEKKAMIMQSVTLVSKSFCSNSSPKEEEIVFHFPPPPRNPPPKEIASESFDIVVKDGSMIVSPNKNKSKSNEPDTNMIDSDTNKDKQVFPQPAPRKSKMRKSASYTNLWAPQSKGYENVFLEKYQTISRLQIDSDKHSKDDKQFSIAKSNNLIKNKITQNKILPDYVNIKSLLSLTPKNKPIKVEPIADRIEKNKIRTENTTDTDMSRSYPEPTLTLVAEKNQFSTYGKIQKNSIRKLSIDEELNFSGIPKYVDKEIQGQNLPSKKLERAPPPPNNPFVSKIKDTSSKIPSPDKSILKRPPSRKHEKAPLPPPHLIQKSSSSASVPKKNTSNSAHYMNFPAAHYLEETSALPAVRENITNTDSYVKLLSKKENEKKEQSQGSPRSLAHSQSDASVFLALKERKTLSLGRGLKLHESKLLVPNKILKQNKEMVSVSSSDSDSGYERIFLDKQSGTNNALHLMQRSTEQTSVPAEKSSSKESPVAPPRARRRNTTEIQYAKVKSKESSQMTHPFALKEKLQSSKGLLTNKEKPPEIPLKTKDAFETLEISQNKGHSLFTDEAQDKQSNASFKP